MILKWKKTLLLQFNTMTDTKYVESSSLHQRLKCDQSECPSLAASVTTLEKNLLLLQKFYPPHNYLPKLPLHLPSEISLYYMPQFRLVGIDNIFICCRGTRQDFACSTSNRTERFVRGSPVAALQTVRGELLCRVFRKIQQESGKELARVQSVGNTCLIYSVYL